MPMQDTSTAIFHGCENKDFQMKNCDIFLNFSQNIDRGYKLDLGGSKEYPSHSTKVEEFLSLN